MAMVGVLFDGHFQTTPFKRSLVKTLSLLLLYSSLQKELIGDHVITKGLPYKNKCSWHTVHS